MYLHRSKGGKGHLRENDPSSPQIYPSFYAGSVNSLSLYLQDGEPQVLVLFLRLFRRRHRRQRKMNRPTNSLYKPLCFTVTNTVHICYMQNHLNKKSNSIFKQREPTKGTYGSPFNPSLLRKYMYRILPSLLHKLCIGFYLEGGF